MVGWQRPIQGRTAFQEASYVNPLLHTHHSSPALTSEQYSKELTLRAYGSYNPTMLRRFVLRLAAFLGLAESSATCSSAGLARAGWSKSHSTSPGRDLNSRRSWSRTSGSRSSLFHDTADRFIYALTERKCRKWIARHWGKQLQGGRECRTMREANEYLATSFAEMFPEHRLLSGAGLILPCRRPEVVTVS